MLQAYSSFPTRFNAFISFQLSPLRLTGDPLGRSHPELYRPHSMSTARWYLLLNTMLKFYRVLQPESTVYSKGLNLSSLEDLLAITFISVSLSSAPRGTEVL